MCQLLVLLVALAHEHPTEFRQGWVNAKAVAEVTDRHRHGLCDDATYWQVRSEHLTAQEKAWFLKHGQEFRRQSEERAKRNEAILKQLQAEWQRRKARRLVGPPAPPDSK